MRKSLLVSLISAAIVCLFAVPAVFAVDAPADMVIKAPAGAKVTKAPVAFSHKGHASMDCKTCHHKWDGAGAIQPCQASGCHANAAAKKGDDSFYMAFHERKSEKSCVGCHKSMKKGPTKCTECHPKN
ncbi:MAG: cytochrome c3 family protein [Desulfovibrio sp.]|uniref:cytochrome c3 family protein n=1 Tax=Desulfovibrio sp. 7SRBS1 TaxID=3378064 RepID=UPI003B3D4924